MNPGSPGGFLSEGVRGFRNHRGKLSSSHDRSAHGRIRSHGGAGAYFEGFEIPQVLGSCPPHEGRLNRSSPSSRTRFESGWTGSESAGTLGRVSVRFPFRGPLRSGDNRPTSCHRLLSFQDPESSPPSYLETRRGINPLIAATIAAASASF